MRYAGTKLIDAEPMDAGAAMDKGYKTGDADQAALGYEVTYPDGYKSWSPAKAFEDAYEPLELIGNENLHRAILSVLKHFKFDHIGNEAARDMSMRYAALAWKTARANPASAETTVALRQLLIGKDAAVRAVLEAENVIVELDQEEK